MSGELKLKRVVSLWESVAFIVGTVIGSGIFVSPKGVLLHAGSPAAALGVWLVTGFVATIEALCQVELGLTYPRIGSHYIYLREAFGETVQFLYAWVMYLFMFGGSSAIVALTFSVYFCRTFLAFFGSSLDCPPPPIATKLVAVSAVWGLAALQSRGTTFGIKTSVALTVGKLLGLAVVIVVGIGHVINSSTDETFQDFWEGSATNPGSYVLAYFSAYWAFGGLSYIVHIVEDVKEPLKRNVLGSVMISIFTVSVVYILANCSYVGALTVNEILSSDAVAMTLMAKVAPTALFWLMPLFVTCSTFATINNTMMGFARGAMAFARRSHVPKALGLLTLSRATPTPVLVANAFLCSLLVFSGGVYDIIVYVSYVITVFGVLVNVAHIKLRLTQPDLKRPFRVPLVVVFASLGLSLLAATLPLLKRPFTSLACLGFIALGIPVYFICVKWRPKVLFEFATTIERFAQKLFVAAPEEFQSFSGKQQVNDEVQVNGNSNAGFVKSEQ